MSVHMEVWKQTLQCFEHVEVSNMARVRTRNTVRRFIKNGTNRTQRIDGRELRPWKAATGYLQVAIQVGAQRKKFLVHRLVALAFVDGYQAGLSVNHINGIKTDNRPENLEWITLAENTRKQWETGLVNLRGEKHPSAKLSDKDAVKVRISSERVAVLAKRYHISTALVYQIKSGRKKAFIQ